MYSVVFSLIEFILKDRIQPILTFLPVKPVYLSNLNQIIPPLRSYVWNTFHSFLGWSLCLLFPGIFFLAVITRPSPTRAGDLNMDDGPGECSVSVCDVMRTVASSSPLSLGIKMGGWWGSDGGHWPVQGRLCHWSDMGISEHSED